MASMNNFYVVDDITYGEGKDGGLILLYNHDINLNILNSNNNYIDCYFECLGIQIMCRLTGVYGFPSLPKK